MLVKISAPLTNISSFCKIEKYLFAIDENFSYIENGRFAASIIVVPESYSSKDKRSPGDEEEQGTGFKHHLRLRLPRAVPNQCDVDVAGALARAPGGERPSHRGGAGQHRGRHRMSSTDDGYLAE